MWTQEHLQGCNRGSSQMLRYQTQDVGSGLILGVMNMGRSLGLGSFFVGPDIWGQGCLSVLSLWKKLAWFSAETETWVQKYLLWP